MAVVEAVRDQFERGWAMVRKTIEATPERLWRDGGIAHVCPARLAYHIAATVDFYTDDREEFPIAKRFGSNWDKAEAEKLPDRDEALQYIQDCERRMDEWLSSHSDESIADQNKSHPWCGKTEMDLALYVLRHTLHHHGEMNAIIVFNGDSSDNWK